MSNQCVKQSGYIQLIGSVFYQQALITIRYPAQFLGSIAVGMVFFSILFYGGQSLAPVKMDRSMGGIIVGYFLWTLSVYAYMGPASNITEEASWGTLERHITTPFGFAPIMLLKGLARVVKSFLISVTILVFAVVLTGETLTVKPLTTGPLLLFTIASVIGVGFAVAGLAVLYKRVSNWRGFFNFALVPLVSSPAIDMPWIEWLPVAKGSAMIQKAVVHGRGLFDFALSDYALLVGTALFYSITGYLVFIMSTERARKLGSLGDY